MSDAQEYLARRIRAVQEREPRPEQLAELQLAFGFASLSVVKNIKDDLIRNQNSAEQPVHPVGSEAGALDDPRAGSGHADGDALAKGHDHDHDHDQDRTGGGTAQLAMPGACDGHGQAPDGPTDGGTTEIEIGIKVG